MSRQKNYRTTRGFCETWTDIDFSTYRNRIVINATTRNLDTEGYRHPQSATLTLSIDDARQFLRMLSEAIDAADDVDDPRQTALWAPVNDRTLNSGQGGLS